MTAAGRRREHRTGHEIDGLALARPGLTTTVDNIHSGLHVQMLRGYPEREPGAVLTRLRSCTDEILRLTADQDPARTFSWLGGSRLPLAGMLAHLANELLLHSWRRSSGKSAYPRELASAGWQCGGRARRELSLPCRGVTA